MIDRFVADYQHGRTPNPCVECNRTVKFSKLLEQSAAFGCDVLVTGHYARVRTVEGRQQLLRGKDRNKDQSYVLAMLGQQELARVRFPVGDLEKVRDPGTRRRARAAHRRTSPTARTSASSARTTTGTSFARSSPRPWPPVRSSIASGQVAGIPSGHSRFHDRPAAGIGRRPRRAPLRGRGATRDLDDRPGRSIRTGGRCGRA